MNPSYREREREKEDAQNVSFLGHFFFLIFWSEHTYSPSISSPTPSGVPLPEETEVPPSISDASSCDSNHSRSPIDPLKLNEPTAEPPFL